jgi:hypothetical protein
VIVPAHDEESRIGATLGSLLADASPGEFDVVVVCNGCADATADVARDVAGVRVLELDEASKIAALQAGDDMTTSFPRVYLDGDVIVTTATVRAIVTAFDRPGVLAVGVPGRVDTSRSTMWVRWFYDFRQRLPVFHGGFIGAGLYAMSAEGRARFGAWPQVLGDDQFVLRLFAPHERTTLQGHHTQVDAPSDLRTVVRRGTRVRRGNAELAGVMPGRLRPPPPSGLSTALRSAARSPRGIAGALTFLATTLVIRLRTRLAAAGDWRATQR